MLKKYFIEVIIAIICGGIIGIEREEKHKAAGFRTYILVSLGACLAMNLAVQIGLDTKMGDMSRIPAGVIQSIGFLGAGVIMFSAKDNAVMGVTTAADLWCMTIIGLIIGYGAYSLAIISTIALWVVNHWFPYLLKFYFNIKDKFKK